MQAGRKRLPLSAWLKWTLFGPRFGPRAAAVEGFDSRYHLGTIPAGYHFAYFKATEGVGWEQTSPGWRNQADFADKQSIPWGLYHFFLDSADPKEQARWFWNVIKSRPGQLPPVLDFEVSSTNARVRDCMAELALVSGKRPMIYTSPHYWNSYIGNQAWILNYDRWVAHWTSAAAPSLPTGWPDWQVWQYTGSVTVPGFTASIDRDRAQDAWLKQFTAPPPPAPPAEVRIEVRVPASVKVDVLPL